MGRRGRPRRRTRKNNDTKTKPHDIDRDFKPTESKMRKGDESRVRKGDESKKRCNPLKTTRRPPSSSNCIQPHKQKYVSRRVQHEPDASNKPHPLRCDHKAHPKVSKIGSFDEDHQPMGREKDTVLGAALVLKIGSSDEDHQAKETEYRSFEETFHQLIQTPLCMGPGLQFDDMDLPLSPLALSHDLASSPLLSTMILEASRKRPASPLLLPLSLSHDLRLGGSKAANESFWTAMDLFRAGAVKTLVDSKAVAWEGAVTESESGEFDSLSDICPSLSDGKLELGLGLSSSVEKEDSTGSPTPVWSMSDSFGSEDKDELMAMTKDELMANVKDELMVMREQKEEAVTTCSCRFGLAVQRQEQKDTKDREAQEAWEMAIAKVMRQHGFAAAEKEAKEPTTAEEKEKDLTANQRSTIRGTRNFCVQLLGC